MTNKKRDTSPKRRSILDAAERAFVDEGFDNASVDRIAELAGASKRTLYNHFPSKEDMFREVVDRLMSDAFALKRIAYDTNGNLSDQLGQFADAKIKLSKTPRWMGMMKVIACVFHTHPELIKEIMMGAKEEEDLLVEWLRAAREDGRLNVPCPEMAATVFWGAVGGAFFWPAIFLGPMETEQANALKDEIIRMFLEYYGVPPVRDT